MSPLRPSSVPAPVTAPAPCAIRFGAERTAVRDGLEVTLPLLAGRPAHVLAGDALAFERAGCRLHEAGPLLAGAAVAPAGMELEAATRELYRRIFAAAEGRPLYRVWNYVPEINRVVDGLENYRRFCRGRADAFEAHFGPGFERTLPAASAVGTADGPLAVAFIAGEAPARYFENPAQIPAFAYPRQYGPRSPSFSRATLGRDAAGPLLFISGTAAIRGHATRGTGDLAAQLDCTLGNLQRIALAAGAGRDVGAARWQRTFSVYLRHDTDLLQVKTFLERHLLNERDAVSYIQADLCRAELLVEIEVVLTAG